MDAKFDAFYSLVENMSDGDLLIIYNQMADENGYERIMLMEEFNDIQFSTNLELADSLANGFNVNDDCFYRSDICGKYHSCETAIQAIEEISSLNELTHYFIENYWACEKYLDDSFYSDIVDSFINYAAKNYDIPCDWLEANIDEHSIIDEDWDQYLTGLEIKYSNSKRIVKEED